MRSLLLLLSAAAALTSASVVPAWRASRPNPASRRAAADTEWWCDPDLGCLEINDNWYSEMRPINQLPDSRDSINTRFMLHTRTDPATDTNVYISADKATVDSTTFDPSKPVKFICHGFIDTGNLAWLKEMADAYLSFGDYNVIRVDWGGGSLPMYSQAVANIRVVGLEIGNLINFLTVEYGLDPASVHLAGHSLGSHASGYAGEQVPGLGRITGMDPAGPYFTGTETFVRVDPSDAVFVDNIHTDADTIFMLGYGTEQPMGNVDFYPNSGHDQPGCDPVTIGIEMIEDLPEGIRDLAACSHGRAYKLHTDSLLQTCPYMAHECHDYLSFEQGRCATCGSDDSMCAAMGINADQYTHKTRELVRMFFDTDKDSPYCYYHYQVVVDTAHPNDAEDSVEGNVVLTLMGDNGNSIYDFPLTEKHETFVHGQPKYFLMTDHIDLGGVMRAEVHWQYDDTLIDNCGMFCNPNLFVRSIQISSMDYYPETNRLEHTKRLCDVGADYVEIESGGDQVLLADDSCPFVG